MSELATLRNRGNTRSERDVGALGDSEMRDHVQYLQTELENARHELKTFQYK